MFFSRSQELLCDDKSILFTVLHDIVVVVRFITIMLEFEGYFFKTEFFVILIYWFGTI